MHSPGGGGGGVMTLYDYGYLATEFQTKRKNFKPIFFGGGANSRGKLLEGKATS